MALLSKILSNALVTQIMKTFRFDRVASPLEPHSEGTCVKIIIIVIFRC